MNRKELMLKLAEQTCLTPKLADEVVKKIFELIVQTIKTWDEVSINGFWKFKQLVFDRIYSNPKTKEWNLKRRTTTVKFKPFAAIKKTEKL